MEDFLRPALDSLLQTGETYQEGIGDSWYERAQAVLRQEEPPAPLSPAGSSWQGRVSKPPLGRSRG
jgi:hypothetical protein